MRGSAVDTLLKNNCELAINKNNSWNEIILHNQPTINSSESNIFPQKRRQVFSRNCSSPEVTTKKRHMKPTK